MRRRFDTYFFWVFSIGDFLASLISLQAAQLILQLSGGFAPVEFSTILGLSGLWILLSVVRQDFKIHRSDKYRPILRKLLGTLVIFLIVISILGPLLQDKEAHWTQVAAMGSVLFGFMGFFRVTFHLIIKKYHINLHSGKNAVTLGRGGMSPELADILTTGEDERINMLGYFDDQAVSAYTPKINDFFEVAPTLDLDIIYVQDQLEATMVRKIIDFADENYLQVKLIPGSGVLPRKKHLFSKYEDLFIFNVNRIPLDNVLNRFIKRAFDLVFSGLVTLLILSWLIPLVGILIKLESGGAVFFVQKRNGLNNKVFRCLKFRSMTPNEYADTLQATKNDPRVTKIGAFLRNTSLDEMPQFINVLLGDMSVIGPRPHTIPMNKAFKHRMGRYNVRHKIRPGITGLAQVSGFRGEIENEYQLRSRVKLDYFYIHHWSFLLDMNIMIRTVRELLCNRDNAY
jgi:putative colanic acid biosynthesis UDP-glucose lipid carrier transferase